MLTKQVRTRRTFKRYQLQRNGKTYSVKILKFGWYKKSTMIGLRLLLYKCLAKIGRKIMRGEYNEMSCM